MRSYDYKMWDIVMGGPYMLTKSKRESEKIGAKAKK